MASSTARQLTLRVQEDHTVIYINIPWDATVRQAKAAIVAKLNKLRVASDDRLKTSEKNRDEYMDPMAAAMMASLSSVGLSLSEPKSTKNQNTSNIPIGLKYTLKDIRIHIPIRSTTFDDIETSIIKLIEENGGNESIQSIIPDKNTLSAEPVSQETGHIADYTGPIPDDFVLTEMGINDFDVIYISLRDLENEENNVFLDVKNPSYAPLYDEEDEFESSQLALPKQKKRDRSGFEQKGKKNVLLHPESEEDEDEDADEEDDDADLDPEKAVRKIRMAERRL